MRAVLDLNDVERAARRIRAHIHRTPVVTNRSIDAITRAEIYFKCENLQKTGAFKIRGAANAVGVLLEAGGAGGVATHSSGNHGAALACAARTHGLAAHVVMPETASAAKKNAAAGYGAHIHYCGPGIDARDHETARVLAQTGAVLVHPYNDYNVIAGQGTVALELLQQTPALDAVLVAVGGGGLTSGVATVMSLKSPATRVIAVEPEGADDAFRSWQQGKLTAVPAPHTIADGLHAPLGDITFAIIRKLVSQIVTVNDAQIVRAMRLVWERMKLVIEPSAAVPLAAVLANKIDVCGQRLAIILSGGNVDLDHMPW